MTRRDKTSHDTNFNNVDKDEKISSHSRTMLKEVGKLKLNRLRKIYYTRKTFVVYQPINFCLSRLLKNFY